jgi:hypothetical protein
MVRIGCEFHDDYIMDSERRSEEQQAASSNMLPNPAISKCSIVYEIKAAEYGEYATI